MRNKINTILLVEIQLVLLLLVFVIFKLYDVEQRVFNTNAFILKDLINKGVEKLKDIDDKDIIIGDQEAPLTVILYSKPDCVHCEAFYRTTFASFYNEFVETGDVKFIIRYLTGASSPLFRDALREFSILKGKDDVQRVMFLSEQNFEGEVESLSDSALLIKNYFNAKEAGIHYTPTFVIGSQVVVGNISLERISEIVREQLELCE